MIRLFLVLMLALLLTGCGLFKTKPPEVVTKTQYVLVKPDNQMVQDCPMAVPPEVDAYTALSLKEREGVLYALSLSSLDYAAKCNAQWQILREWYTKQSALYPDVPTAIEKKP